MQKEITRVGVEARWSQVARFQNVLYLAGQVPSNVDADIQGQTAEVLAKIDTILKENGSDKTRILNCQIYLAHIQQAPAMNEVWDKWVVPGHTPPRATVEARLVSPQKLVEICVTAAVAPEFQD